MDFSLSDKRYFIIYHSPIIIPTLENIALKITNDEVSASSLIRVIFFRCLLLWLERASSVFGQDIIRKQKTLDARTQEVFSTLYEVRLFCIIAILLLNMISINLTTLAFFGVAVSVGVGVGVGVDVGVGLQWIATNFKFENYNSLRPIIDCW
jgi:small-conductance mechanosensitive channel